MNSRIKKIWNAVTTVLVVFVVVLAFLLVGARVVGLRVYTVLSGSMEPTYPVGSLIYVKEVDYTTLESGDVITFMMDEDVVATHRIVEVLPDEQDASVLRFRTKGDANEMIDGTPVHYKNVIGKAVFAIPLLGYFSNFVQSPPGSYIAIAIGALLLFLAFMPEIFRKEEKEEKDTGV